MDDNTNLKETSFNRLVQRGKVKEASRVINKNINGYVLNPEDIVDDSDRTVFALPKEHHPVPTIPDITLLKL